MVRLRSNILLAAAVLGSASAGSTNAQRSPQKAASVSAATRGCDSTFAAADWSVFLKEIDSKKPEAAARLRSDPAFREEQVRSIRELIALACQAEKDGALKDAVNADEFENIRTEVVATSYETVAYKGEQQPALSSVSEERAARFYAVAGNEAKFEKYLATKVALLTRSGGNPTVTAADRSQARLQFARLSILANEARSKAPALDSGFAASVALNVRLQRAQFLARWEAERFIERIVATEGEIDEYIRSHPELDTTAKRTLAESILKRALAGEDFATLANTYSDDPGNGKAEGSLHGGLYADVPKGRMIAAFEKAALALSPGTVSPVLTQTEHGYHIIKLEKKTGAGPDETYDVRHVLISTSYKDPSAPDGADVPIREYVRGRIEKQKETDVLEVILRDNPVNIAPVPLTVAKTAAPATAKKPPVKRRARK